MTIDLNGQRILAVIYGTELFGSERANLEALYAMQSRGAEIYVAVSGRAEGGGATGIRARELGFSTFEMPFGSHFAREWMLHDKAYRNRQLKRIWTNSRLLSRKIREIQPTMLMFSTVLSFMFCGLATLLNRMPIIYRIGDAPPVDSKFQMIFWKWLVRRANHVVCVSDFIREEVLEHSRKSPYHVTRIYNVPISRAGDPNSEQISQLRESKRPLQFVYVGQINPAKGIVELLDAAIQINDDQVGLWVVGGGGFNDVLLEELKEKTMQSKTQTCIEYFGFQADPRPYYMAADWHIAPSVYHEPMANTTFEAKAAGIPSVVSNRGGFPEVIRHQLDGFILEDPLNEHAIVQSFKWISDQMKNHHAQMKVNANASIEENFNYNQFTRDWVHVVQSTSQ